MTCATVLGLSCSIRAEPSGQAVDVKNGNLLQGIARKRTKLKPKDIIVWPIR